MLEESPVTKKASFEESLLEVETSRLLGGPEDHGSSDGIGFYDSVHQRLALKVLHKHKEVFKLVPEHVETRTLYNSKEPGIPQVGQCNSMCV